MAAHERYYRVRPYIITETIGVGSFGKVKLAVHEGTGRQYACKILEKSLVKQRTLNLQVKKEIDIMSCLRHINTVSLVNVLASATKVFIVMELVHGGELFNEILRHKRLSEPYARFYFRQLIDGVEHCHRHGVFHRDLKPENLLLTNDKVLKITDFGLSSLKRGSSVESTTQSFILHTQCGTPHYVAPEIITLHSEGYSGARVDIWSCGIILYVLVAGKLPFEAAEMDTLFKLILRGDIDFPPQFSLELRDLISNMLKTTPSRRYTIDQIRTHPWFTDPRCESSMPSPDESALPCAPHTPEQLSTELLSSAMRLSRDAADGHAALSSGTSASSFFTGPPKPPMRREDSLDLQIHAHVVDSELTLPAIPRPDSNDPLFADDDRSERALGVRGDEHEAGEAAAQRRTSSGEHVESMRLPDIVVEPNSEEVAEHSDEQQAERLEHELADFQSEPTSPQTVPKSPSSPATYVSEGNSVASPAQTSDAVVAAHLRHYSGHSLTAHSSSDTGGNSSDDDEPEVEVEVIYGKPEGNGPVGDGMHVEYASRSPLSREHVLRAGRSRMRRVQSLTNVTSGADGQSIHSESNVSYAAPSVDASTSSQFRRDMWNKDSGEIWRRSARSYHTGLYLAAESDVPPVNVEEIRSDVRRLFAESDTSSPETDDERPRERQRFAAQGAGSVYVRSRGASRDAEGSASQTSGGMLFVRSSSHDGSLSVRALSRLSRAVQKDGTHEAAVSGPHNGAEGHATDEAQRRPVTGQRTVHFSDNVQFVESRGEARMAVMTERLRASGVTRKTSVRHSQRLRVQASREAERAGEPRRSRDADDFGRDGFAEESTFHPDNNWLRSGTDRMVWCKLTKGYDMVPDELEFGMDSATLNDLWGKAMSDVGLRRAYHAPLPVNRQVLSRHTSSHKARKRRTRKRQMGEVDFSDEISRASSEAESWSVSGASGEAGVADVSKEESNEERMQEAGGDGTSVAGATGVPKGTATGVPKGGAPGVPKGGAVEEAFANGREVTMLQSGAEPSILMYVWKPDGTKAEQGKEGDGVAVVDEGAEQRQGEQDKAVVAMNSGETTIVVEPGSIPESSNSTGGAVDGNANAKMRRVKNAAHAAVVSGVAAGVARKNANRNRMTPSTASPVSPMRSGGAEGRSIGSGGNSAALRDHSDVEEPVDGVSVDALASLTKGIMENDVRRLSPRSVQGTTSTQFGSTSSVLMDSGERTNRSHIRDVDSIIAVAGVNEQTSTPALSAVSTGTEGGETRQGPKRVPRARQDPRCESDVVSEEMIKKMMMRTVDGDENIVEIQPLPVQKPSVAKAGLGNREAVNPFDLDIPSPRGAKLPARQMLPHRSTLSSTMSSFWGNFFQLARSAPMFLSLLQPVDCFRVMSGVLDRYGCGVVNGWRSGERKFKIKCEWAGKKRKLHVTVVMFRRSEEGLSTLLFKRNDLASRIDGEEFWAFYQAIRALYRKESKQTVFRNEEGDGHKRGNSDIGHLESRHTWGFAKRRAMDLLLRTVGGWSGHGGTDDPTVSGQTRSTVGAVPKERAKNVTQSM